MARLHEVLAVDDEARKAFVKIGEETIKVFSDKPALFQGWVKTLKMFDEDRKQEENAAREEQALTTTVQEKLDYFKGFAVRYLDILAQKEATNQVARADVILDGDSDPILKNVPVTFLLALEKQLSQWRTVYNSIPTLQTGMTWTEDEQRGKGVFVSNQTMSIRTENVPVPVELSPATKEHKAQVTAINKDRPIGEYTKTTWSGMLTSARKSELLGRIDELIRAVKQARMRANNEEVIDFRASAKLWEYINR